VCEFDFAGVRVLARHRRGGPPAGKSLEARQAPDPGGGTGIDIAYAVLYLALDESSW